MTFRLYEFLCYKWELATLMSFKFPIFVYGIAPPAMMFFSTTNREVGRYDGYDVKYTQKISAKQVWNLGLFMVDKVKHHIPKHQQLVMEKLLCQRPTMLLLGTTCAPLDHCFFLKNILKFLIRLSKNIKFLKSFLNTIMLRCMF